MAIEFIPKNDQTVPVEKLAFFISLAILLVVAVFSVFLYISNQEKENTKIEIGNQIIQIQSQKIDELESQVLFRKIQLEKAKELLSIHKFPSKIFDFLESNLAKGIKVSKLGIVFDEKTATAVIGGKAADFKDISLQEINFKKQENLDNFLISEIKQDTTTSNIVFSSIIKFKEEFLRFKEE
ncbi:MAG: hypothetical protein Q8O39_00620 [bacterium]|nr:hypothetical protein [bacterium]